MTIIQASGGEDTTRAAFRQLNAARVSAIEYHRANLQRSVFYTAVCKTFETYDLVLTPQMPVAAWPADPDRRALRDP